MRGKNIAHFVLGAALAAGGLYSIAVGDMLNFQPGTPIKSAEVNQNFSSLKSAVQALEAPIGVSRLSITGTAADGKVLKLSGGALAWADDLVGTGSSTYSAGSGLSLTDTTFSIADGGVTASKLAASGAADGKVLKLAGGNLSWADDQIGAGGGGGDVSAVAAGTGLEGGGTSGDLTLSVAGAFRLPQKCGNGQIPKWNGSTWACGDDGVGTGGGGGDITAVAAGSGLSGGGQSGDVSLAVNTTAIQSRVGGTCPAGQAIREVKQDGSVTCEADDNTTYSADNATLQLSGTTFSIKGGGVSGNKIQVPLALESTSLVGTLRIFNANPSGYGMVVSTEPSYPFIQGAAIVAHSGLGPGIFSTSTNDTGVYGKTEKGNGVYGRSDTGTGVYGQVDQQSGFNLGGAKAGVWGDSNTGHGVAGTSAAAHGVVGFSPNTGVGGYNTGGSSGVGIYGFGGSGIAAKFVNGSSGGGSCEYRGGSGWLCTSDKNAKENFRAVNPVQVLDSLIKMPITRWNMKGDKSKIPHLGPTAQDFKKAFGLGDDDKTINTADAQGVVMAAIQGLNQKLETENNHLSARIAKLEKQLASLKATEERLARLEQVLSTDVSVVR